MKTLQATAVPEQLSLLGATTGMLAYQHPQANRQVMFKDVLVAYRLVVAKRKSIGFVIGSAGLEVRCPRWVSTGDVDVALRSKSDWILRKLQDQHERKQQRPKNLLQGHPGEQLLYRGQPLVLEVTSGLRLSCEITGEAGSSSRRLSVSLPDGADTRRVVDAVNAWLMQTALAHFLQRVAHFAPIMQVQPTRVQLSNAQTRWGTAHSDGRIRLNWRLIHLDDALTDYVVVHELAHLHEMNHSPRFWRVVEQVLPDYVRRKQSLRQQGLAME
jgi:predicted metal-dependent hydrolase